MDGSDSLVRCGNKACFCSACLNTYGWVAGLVHEVLVNRLGGLSLPRKSVVRLTDRPDMTLDVYRGRKTINQQQHLIQEMDACIHE